MGSEVHIDIYDDRLTITSPEMCIRDSYKAWTGNSMEEKLLDSFEMRDDHGKLTNAGALLADDAPIKHSRLF